MAPAWLDSLSEDWVSEPNSDASPDNQSTYSDSQAGSQHGSSRGSVSRASRLGQDDTKAPPNARDRSAVALSERSSNDINMRASQRPASKSLQGARHSQLRGRQDGHSYPNSTTSSVVHNTVHHKSGSVSPVKSNDEAPEWKRRLLYGEMSYGESKDLFSSAANGLEGIFRPPPPALSDLPSDDEDADDANVTFNDMTLPSSPPPYWKRSREASREEPEKGESSETSNHQPRYRKKQVRYSPKDTPYVDHSRIDDSTAEPNPPAQDTTAPKDHSRLSVPSAGANEASQKMSGKSVGFNEAFSPILLSPRKDDDGVVSFVPMELSPGQLRKRLDKLRKNQMIVDSDSSSHAQHSMDESACNPDTTHDYARNSGFLNFRRGDQSGDGSFQRRPLSPPLNNDTSEMLPESSLQASTPKQFPNMRTEPFTSTQSAGRPTTPPSPDMPPAPNPSPERQQRPPTAAPVAAASAAAAAAAAASPLKLFGPYDTFTNQTLLRRISQFEDTESPPRPTDQPDLTTSELPFRRSSRKTQQTNQTSNAALKARFGVGELDGYSFNEDLSMNDHSAFANKENVAPEASPLRSHPIKFDISQPSGSEDESLMIPPRRNKSNAATDPSKQAKASPTARSFATRGGSLDRLVTRFGLLATPKREGSESKRPRTSPSKDPTPKRRRTLHKSDIAFGLESKYKAIESVQASHSHMQYAMARRRKGLLRYGESQTASSPSGAAHQALRQRSPTPSPRASMQREREPLADLEFSTLHDESTMPDQESEFFIPDRASNGARNGSIRTQDFLVEAEKIMAMIRSKGRPQYGLSVVDESTMHPSEHDGSSSSGYDEDEDSYQDSTQESFLRPPSREGRPVRSRQAACADNPELASKLKQYEETSDMSDLMTGSLRQSEMAKRALRHGGKASDFVQQCLRSGERRHNDSEDDDVISDLSNVRISRNPDGPLVEDSHDVWSHGWRSSGSSAPTASSRGSATDSRRLIGPDVVSQLIGNQVGNMVLDDENKVWMKVKTPRTSAKDFNLVPSEDSEDDPFGSIPDLSVDETKEIQNLMMRTAPIDDVTPPDEHAPLDDLNEFIREDDEDAPSASTGRKSRTTGQTGSTSSMLSHTREALSKIRQTLVDTAVENDEEIEHEITIHEDRVKKMSPSRRRNLTITFSSPIASIIQDILPEPSDEEIASENNEREEDDDDEDVASGKDESDGTRAVDSLRRGRHLQTEPDAARRSTKSRSRSRSRSARGVSVKGRAFVRRPVSRIEEQDEESMPDRNASAQRQLSLRGNSSIVGPEKEKHQTSVSFVLTTPAPARKTAPPCATPAVSQNVGTLSLSPLSDFTMNHGDQSCGLEVSYVMGRNYLVTGDGTKKRMSQAVRTLVEKITEVQPFEPDWGAMQALDISGKQLTSLHKLDEFCGNVVTLDASDNNIRQLEGVPESVRNLKAAQNCLSGLTAWGHLMNLQYVDISNNEINSLYAFKDLVHLRTLRADNNRITSLEGIKFHDALQVLRARGNLIEHVDLDGAAMDRLTELDLEGNRIREIHNLEQLPCLATLNLDKNQLTSFAPTEAASMPWLRYVKLSGNALTTLDLTAFPGLRLLHADGNLIRTLLGCARARRLDSLSLREQRGDEQLDLSFLGQACEVRKLFLSGNLLDAFDPPLDLLNLQYLELANCGLQTLPPHLGQLLPNLRTLNLNFNAVGDLAPLRYIPRLKKLLAAGNRLADVGALAAALAEFPHLAKVDLRNNPATLGFYPPLQTLVEVGSEPQHSGIDLFVLPEASPERDGSYSARLDARTKQRKRLYDLALAQRCPRLRLLDGLTLDRDAVMRRDDVWAALAARGAVTEKPGRRPPTTPRKA